MFLRYKYINCFCKFWIFCDVWLLCFLFVKCIYDFVYIYVLLVIDVSGCSDFYCVFLSIKFLFLLIY